jgi:hypothetical protein
MDRREPNDPTEAVLRIHRGEDAHEVPADVLARALIGVQQTALLLAATATNQEVRERFRPSAELRERATLLCEVPTMGSFAMPMRLAEGQLLLPLGDGGEIGLMDAIHGLLRSVATGSADFLRKLLPDSVLRAKALREIQRLLPQPGDPWAIGFSSHEHKETILDDRAVRMVEEWIAAELAPTDTTMTVTGELIGVFFDEKRVVIRYKPTKRPINCFLRDDVVDALLEHRVAVARSGAGSYKIQVTGEFTLDRNEHPTKLTNVYRVAPVDTSPMVFDRVHHKGRTFLAVPPLKLDLSLDQESEQYYVAEDKDLGLSVYAQTREQVSEDVAAQIAFNWDQYAQEAPEKLAKGALCLQAAMLKRVSATNA